MRFDCEKKRKKRCSAPPAGPATLQDWYAPISMGSSFGKR